MRILRIIRSRSVATLHTRATAMDPETGEADGAVKESEGETVDDEGDDDKIEEMLETNQARDLCLEILPLIKQSQNQRGLRHGDYQRYRHYCSRRMRRIRRSLNFTHGHRHRFQKKVLTVEKVTELRYLYLPLVCAERSWAMAMELKQEINSDPRKKFHLLRRLKKAAKHAEHLLQLSEACERCDARTRLEAQAYKCWMSANVKFVQQKWQKSREEFGQCQTIYEKLGGAVPDDQKVVYAQRVEEMVPNIRYCAYNIGDSTDLSELVKLRPDAPGLSSKIDDVLSKTQEKAATSLSEVTWREQRLPVRNEKLRVGLIKLQQLEGELRVRRMAEGDKGKMEMYEQLLMECQDAMQIVREDIAAETSLLEKKKRSQKAEVHMDTLKQLMDYLTHFKLTMAIDRNLHLLQTMKNPKPGARSPKPEEFVRVFDILLQHVTDLGDILGAEDLTSQKYIAALTLAFKSFRCYYLSESYVVMRKWAEAVGLLDRALEHVTQSLEQYRSLEQGTTAVNVKIDQEKFSTVHLQQLRETIKGRKCEVHVNSVLEADEVEEKMSQLSLSTKPLSECMDEFAPVPPTQKVTLAPLPPDYQALPCKPLFFDLALNHVAFPSLAHRAEKKPGGITGLVKGWIWGSKS